MITFEVAYLKNILSKCPLLLANLFHTYLLHVMKLTITDHFIADIFTMVF